MAREALGKGLNALLSDMNLREGEAFVQVEVGKIRPNPHQPREEFDQEKLRSLADSIRRNGMAQPILLRRAGDGYEIVFGERRWRAARMAGMERIPAIIREVSDLGSIELALIENLQREDLNPLEKARAYSKLIDEFGLTQEELSVKVGLDRASIANYLRLLNLPPNIQEDLVRGRLTMGHARALLSIGSLARQQQVRRRAIKEGLSVRDVEVLAGKTAPRPAKQRLKGKDPFLAAAEERLGRLLGTKVMIRAGRKGGKIEIHYFSEDDLIRVVDILTE